MRVTVHIPDELGEIASNYADREGVSVSQFYARAVEEAIARRKRREAHARISSLADTVDSDEYSREHFDQVQSELREDDSDR